MAIYSQKCAVCTDPAKQCIGEYWGRDEDGNYSGTMYTCGNMHCEISTALRKTSKDLPPALEKKRAAHDSGRNDAFHSRIHIGNNGGYRRFSRKNRDK